MAGTGRELLWFFRPTLIAIGCFGLAVIAGLMIDRVRDESPDVSAVTSANRTSVALEDGSDRAAAARLLQGLQQPAPSLMPEDVVRIQLRALASEDRSRGILQCFTLASPANRSATGPLPRFAQMVSQPPYDLLVHADAVVVGRPLLQEQNTARVLVVALQGDRLESYVWVLSKQVGTKHDGCWMTDSVLLIESPRSRSAPQAERTARVRSRQFCPLSCIHSPCFLVGSSTVAKSGRLLDWSEQV